MGTEITSIMFYIFSSVAVVSALFVIFSRISVHSIMWLILVFFNVAGIFILLEAEFLAMLLVMVYVGAVMVLFVFIVMMLDVQIAQIKESLTKYAPVFALISLIFFIELVILIQSHDMQIYAHRISTLEYAVPVSNIERLAQVLYTEYFLVFQLSGILLFVAMVGSIILTHRPSLLVRRQNILNQLSRQASDTIEIVKISKNDERLSENNSVNQKDN